MRLELSKIKLVNIFLLIILAGSRCVSEFVPEINEENELLVVEGLITNQPEPYTIKVSRSLPVGTKTEARPVSECVVTVTDNMDVRIRFAETEPGTYVSPEGFIGSVGKSYKVNIIAPSAKGSRNYESFWSLMLPVAEIENLYYEKIKVRDEDKDIFDVEACQVYLDTYGNGTESKNLRWEYFETWVLRHPFSVPNQKCWEFDRSKNIVIRKTSSLSSLVLKRMPVLYISESTDRLRTRYSILVNQYSMNDEEYDFWEALKKLTEQSGGLYDIIPSSIPSNIVCLDDRNETVLGYFSVSAKSSRRIYIDEEFKGIYDPYKYCIIDTIYGGGIIPRLDTAVWILFDIIQTFPKPRLRILTDDHGCYDCTDRGTLDQPSFWTDQ